MWHWGTIGHSMTIDSQPVEELELLSELYAGGGHPGEQSGVVDVYGEESIAAGGLAEMAAGERAFGQVARHQRQQQAQVLHHPHHVDVGQHRAETHTRAETRGGSTLVWLVFLQ